MKTIDLRSDTVTRPSAGMRRAMFEAEVGDDVLGDDPTVIRLQERAAGLLGKDAGLYFPSGTMCNQAALRALTRRGDEVFLHAQAHIMFYEQGGASALSNVQLRCFDSPDGTLDLEKMEEYVHTDADVHWAPTRVVCLENTHNHCGGVVLPIDHVRAVREFCDRHDLRLHLDGARLFNAVTASGIPAAECAAAFDTVSICLSKGLGAPVGSVLVGDVDTIALARRARKLYGGGMRQAGIIAAAGLYALDHNVARLSDDHRRARVLAERLAALPGLAVDLVTVQTNMVFAGTRGAGVPAADLVARLGEAGVLCLDEGPWTVRFVTHLDLDDDD
ncbi:MAG TPA: low-specificity L-threonine aldolase, partial [Thermoleophilia bacterium]